MQVGVGISGNSNVGVNFYGSYAISEKHFVSVNYLFWRGDVEVDTTGKSCCSIFGDRDSWGSRGTVFEARFGRYWKHLDDPRWRAEIGLNLGYGSISNLRENSDFANVEYINFGIQPTVGFKSRVMWIMGTVKAAYLSYHHFESNFINSEEQAALANFRRKNQNTFIFEPGFVIGVSIANTVILSYSQSYSSFNSSNLSIKHLPEVGDRNASLSMIIRVDYDDIF